MGSEMCIRDRVIGIMVVIMLIGLIIDGVIFKRLETKVMSRWGLR